MTIMMEEELDPGFDFDYRGLAEKVIISALSYENFPYEAEVTVTLTSDEAIRDLNREYRRTDAATDVLSFPMLDIEKGGDFSFLEEAAEGSFNPDTGEALLGDIVISVPRVIGQAAAYGHAVKREFAFLIVHSVLHLLGYDHELPEEAACMERKQEKILEKLEILR